MTGVTDRPAAVRRLVLTGFMGSGKTTVGRALAGRLGWRFADLDDVVAGQHGLTVPEIFAAKGEPFFREAETAALRALLRQAEIVIALGGGAPETAALRAMLADSPATAVVHLHAPFEDLYARCVAQAADTTATFRPLLGEQHVAAARFARRLPFYTEVATCIARADAGSPEAVADQILAKVFHSVASL